MVQAAHVAMASFISIGLKFMQQLTKHFPHRIQFFTLTVQIFWPLEASVLSSFRLASESLFGQAGDWLGRAAKVYYSRDYIIT